MHSEQNNDRLDSWKEIAAYLRQGVRTVQRWELDSGLPVYRPPGKKRGTVFAFRSELDSWWEVQKNGTANGSARARSTRRRLTIGILGGLGAVLIGGFFAYRLFKAGPADIFSEGGTAALRFTRAAVSPDARWLAYSDEMLAHLRLRNLQTGEDRLLVDDWTELFAWSRDSLRIAYNVGSSPPYRLEVLNVRTGVRSRIAAAGRPGTLFRIHDWSLDGRRLLCTRLSPDQPMMMETGFVSVEDGSFVSFLTLPVGAQFFRLSPDNRLVAYSSRREGNSDIYVARTDGSSREARLTRHSDSDREPVWSPDGRYVLFDRRNGSDRDNSLWGVKIESGETITAKQPERIGDLGYDSALFRKSFTPEGELLTGRQESRTQCHLVEVDPATGLPIGDPVSDFPELSSCLHWSKDSNRIIYEDWLLSEESPDPVQVERNIKTGEERLLTSPVAEELTTPVWHIPYPPKNLPDYRWRFFRKSGERFIYRYDVETEETTVFYEAAAPITGVGISPNADYLSFRLHIGFWREYEIWLLRLADGQARKVATTGLNPVTTWSRDGSELAFPDTNCLMVMAPEDAEPTRLTCTTPPNLPEAAGQWGPLRRQLWWVPLAAGWSPDGTKLTWSIPVPENRRVELWIVDRATGEHQVAFAGEENYYTMPVGGAWSFDGRWLAMDIHWYPDLEIRPYPDVPAKLRTVRGAAAVAKTVGVADK